MALEASRMLVTGHVARNSKDKLAAFNSQIALIENWVGFKKEATKNARFTVPARLDEALKGKLLIKAMDTFVDSYRTDVPVIRYALKRIGHDLHPDTSVFWGMETYHATTAEVIDW